MKKVLDTLVTGITYNIALIYPHILFEYYSKPAALA